jgi:hypothetical protein
VRVRGPGPRRQRLLAAVIPLLIGIPAVVALNSPRAAADTPGTGSSCPTSNPPNELVLGGGTPQTAQLATAFATPLQVALANSNGCPVTSVVGTPVTFTAPSSGAGGSFATSGANAVTVGADLSGNASAPTFTANDVAGSYTVTATSADGSVSFSMTNSAAGIPATVTPLSPVNQSATVQSHYAHPLSVRVLDANGNPVSGATVTFAFGTTASGGSGGSAGASFADGSAQATAVTASDGIATSPNFTANGTVGRFIATATTAANVAHFTLSNRAGKPATITAGVAASEATQTGTRFAIALAVTVTDALGNKVPRVLVTFTAPASSASGSFATRTHSRKVSVRTDGRGIAVAPPFIANAQAGGYIVIARIPHGPRTAFALVNEAS